MDTSTKPGSQQAETAFRGLATQLGIPVGAVLSQGDRARVLTAVKRLLMQVEEATAQLAVFRDDHTERTRTGRPPG